MPNTPDKTLSRKKGGSKPPAKAYSWEFVLYPDDPQFSYQLGRICDISSHWCYIEHYADLREADEEVQSDEVILKKKHLHFLAFFDNQRHRTALCGELFGDKRHTSQIQHIENKVMALRYLLHLDDPEKAKYGRAEVLFSDAYMRDMAHDAWDRLVETHESCPIVVLLAYIEDSEGAVSCSELLKFAISSGVYAEYRRSYSLIRDIVREHNSYVATSEMRDFAVQMERKRQLTFRKSQIGTFSEVKYSGGDDLPLTFFEKGG